MTKPALILFVAIVLLLTPCLAGCKAKSAPKPETSPETVADTTMIVADSLINQSLIPGAGAQPQKNPEQAETKVFTSQNRGYPVYL